MKVTVESIEKDGIDYSVVQLVVYADNVVQISSNQSGCNPGLFRGQNIKTGYSSDNFIKENFEKFSGVVTIMQ